MSEDFDLKVFRAYPQSEPPVGTVDKLYKGPSRKAVVTGVVFLSTLLTIAILGNGAVLYFSFARDKAIQADLKSLRLDMAKLNSVPTKAGVEGCNVNLKQNLGDDTALIEQFEVIAQGEKEINETIMTLRKDLEDASTAIEETLERVTNVTKTATHQPMDANELDNVLQLTLKKLYNMSDKVNEISMMQKHMKMSLTTVYDKLHVGIEGKDSNVTLEPDNKGNENVHLKEETSETAFTSRMCTSMLTEMRESLEDKLAQVHVSIQIETANAVADTMRNMSNALMFEISDALNTKQAYTLNKMFRETNSSFDLILDALQNISTHVTSDLNRLATRYERNIRRVRADAEGVSQKLDLLRSDQMNIENRTSFRQKEVTQSILLDIDRTSQKLDNMTDWLLLIFNNTELTEKREHEIMTTLSVITADILNVSSNMKSYHADIRVLEENYAKMDQNNTKHAKEIKEQTDLISTQLSHIQTDLMMEYNITRHANNRLSMFLPSLSRNFTDMSDTLLAALGQYSQNVTDMTNMIASQSESQSTRLSSVTDKLGTTQNTVNNLNTHMEFMEKNLLETMNGMYNNISTELGMYEQNFKTMTQLLDEMSTNIEQNSQYMENNTVNSDNKLSAISGTLDGMSTMLSSISGSVSSVSSTVSSVSNTVASVNSTLASVSSTLSSIHGTVASIKSTVSSSSGIISSISSRTSSISGTVSTISSNTSSISNTVSTLLSSKLLSIGNAMSTISSKTSSISNAVSTISSTTSSISNTVSTISSKTSSISNTVSIISNRTSSISDTVSTISSKTSSISNAVSTVSSRTSLISDTVSTISNGTSSISSTVSSISNSTSSFDSLVSSLSSTVCRSSCPYRTLRLVSSSGSIATSSGRIEIWHNGTWGTVCDDGFNNNAATVACKTLGYDSGVAKSKAHFGQGSGKIWMDDVACSSTAVDLFSCRHKVLGTHNCNHGEDVGVICS